MADSQVGDGDLFDGMVGDSGEDGGVVGGGADAVDLVEGDAADGSGCEGLDDLERELDKRSGVHAILTPVFHQHKDKRLSKLVHG